MGTKKTKISEGQWPSKIIAVRELDSERRRFWVAWGQSLPSEPPCSSVAYLRDDIVEKEMRDVINMREDAIRRESHLHAALLDMRDDKRRLAQLLLDNNIELPEDTLDGIKVYPTWDKPGVVITRLPKALASSP